MCQTKMAATPGCHRTPWLVAPVVVLTQISTAPNCQHTASSLLSIWANPLLWQDQNEAQRRSRNTVWATKRACVTTRIWTQFMANHRTLWCRCAKAATPSGVPSVTSLISGGRPSLQENQCTPTQTRRSRDNRAGAALTCPRRVRVRRSTRRTPRPPRHLHPYLLPRRSHPPLPHPHPRTQRPRTTRARRTRWRDATRSCRNRGHARAVCRATPAKGSPQSVSQRFF